MLDISVEVVVVEVGVFVEQGPGSDANGFYLVFAVHHKTIVTISMIVEVKIQNGFLVPGRCLLDKFPE